MTSLMEEREWERDLNQTLRLNLILGNPYGSKLKTANIHWLVMLKGEHFHILAFILLTSIY